MEINIIPIFNQEMPGVWADFGRIRAAARECVGQSDKYAAIESENFVRGCRIIWENWPGQAFAFMAYDGVNPVGFINGHVRHCNAIVTHLYILPQYHLKHIGGRLLKCAENSMSLVANQIGMISLPNVTGFYAHHGYMATYVGGDEFIKSICPPKNTIVPVFSINEMLAGNSADTIRQYDIRQRVADIHAHPAAFAYVDNACRVSGIAVEYAPNQIHVLPGKDYDAIRKQLESELVRAIKFKNK